MTEETARQGDPETSTNLEPPHVAVAVGAHPDDVDLGCGGAPAKWASTGTSYDDFGSEGAEVFKIMGNL